MSPELAITARGLSKAFPLARRPADLVRHALGSGRERREYFWALRGLDLDVAHGETLGVIGRNGSGKSTLLQLICGTLAPTTGELLVRGRLAAILEIGGGFNREFTGRENVHLIATVLGLDRSQIRERFDAIAGFADIGTYIDQPVKHYSSGMCARLAFAICVHVDADILVIDEALGVGDGAFQRKCMDYLDGFRRRGTLLFASHDNGAVADLCSRVLWLEHGELRGEGRFDEVSRLCSAALAVDPDGHSDTRRARGGDARGWTQVPAPPLISDFRAKRHGPNRIVISDFDRDAPWHGFGGASIEHVGFHDACGVPLQAVDGGEEVELRVVFRAERAIARSIVGFILRDEFGQNLFGDNTYLAFADRPVAAGERAAVSFRFQLPLFPVGVYSLAPSIIEGTQHNHVHLNWIEEAVVLRSVLSHVHNGVLGVPMTDIKIKVA
jgi:lipopolysaccharide transport system ATP-binding protein